MSAETYVQMMRDYEMIEAYSKSLLDSTDRRSGMPATDASSPASVGVSTGSMSGRYYGKSLLEDYLNLQQLTYPSARALLAGLDGLRRYSEQDVTITKEMMDDAVYNPDKDSFTLPRRFFPHPLFTSPIAPAVEAGFPSQPTHSSGVDTMQDQNTTEAMKAASAFGQAWENVNRGYSILITQKDRAIDALRRQRDEAWNERNESAQRAERYFRMYENMLNSAQTLQDQLNDVEETIAILLAGEHG